MTKYRIVNKNEKGCIINILPQGLTEITWEEFNRKYLIKEKVYAILNPIWQEREDKFNALIEEAIEIFTRNEKIKEPNADDSKRLNEIVAEIVKIRHVKIDDALTMIREKIQLDRKRKDNRKAKKTQKFMESLGSNKESSKKPREYKDKNLKGVTLADFSPELAQLKEKFS